MLMFWADAIKENTNKNKSNFIFIEIAYWLITVYQKLNPVNLTQNTFTT